MENREIIKKEAILIKQDNNYFLKLALSESVVAEINITDTEQNELDKEYAKIIYYCLNNKKTLFAFEAKIDETIDSSGDSGVIAIIKEYISILNNEIANIYSSWEEKIENKI